MTFVNLGEWIGLDPGWVTVIVMAAMIVGLVQERLTPDVIVLGALVLLMLSGVVNPEEALAGFSSGAMITVAALFVVAGAMRHTGALQVVSGAVFGKTRSLRQALVRLTGVTTVASAFLNNTPIVAMFLPTVMTWGKRSQLSPSKLLIPLSYAAIVGGVCTLIGTSTNLLVSEMIRANGMEPLAMFELAWVGVPCAIVALTYLIVLGPRLLPSRTDVLNRTGDQQRQYLVEMMLRGPSPLIGQTVEDAGLRHLGGLFLVRIERESGVISPVSPGEVLREGDRMTFAGVVETIVELQKSFRGLVPSVHDRPPEADERWVLHETVVSTSSPLVGQTIREANFRGRYNAAVVAVHRHGARVPLKIGDITLHPGDTLLLESAPGFARSFRDSTDFYLVSEVEQSSPPRRSRAPAAALILVAVVAAAATGLLSIEIAALAGAMGVIAMGCVSPGQARRSVDASVVIVIGASLGIARAMDKSGVASQIAHHLVILGAKLGPVGVLIAIYGVTMLLTELITNSAAAALVFPIALASAGELGVDPRPFAIAVAVAASLSFATPLGYQTNLMVYGPGGYRFSDFLRVGAPLQLILGGVALTAISLVWSI